MSFFSRALVRIARRFGRRGSGAFVGTMVSFPKSGRTWLRLMLDSLGVALEYTHAGSGHLDRTHRDDLGVDGSAFAVPPVVFLHRDPRDVVVSGYFQATKRIKVYTGGMKGFLRDPRHGLEKVIRFNLLWRDLAGERGLHVTSYEELREGGPAPLRAMLEFLEAEGISDQDLRRVIEATRFDKVQRMEKEGALAERYGGKFAPKDVADRDTYKARRGKVGGFRDYFDEEDLEFAKALLAENDYFNRMRP